jgi:hypothetical protein
MTDGVDDNLKMAVKHENHEEMGQSCRRDARKGLFRSWQALFISREASGKKADLIESKPNLDHSLNLSVDTWDPSGELQPPGDYSVQRNG